MFTGYGVSQNWSLYVLLGAIACVLNIVLSSIKRACFVNGQRITAQVLDQLDLRSGGKSNSWRYLYSINGKEYRRVGRFHSGLKQGDHVEVMVDPTKPGVSFPAPADTEEAIRQMNIGIVGLSLICAFCIWLLFFT